jgi:hypothetical protein
MVLKLYNALYGLYTVTLNELKSISQASAQEALKGLPQPRNIKILMRKTTDLRKNKTIKRNNLDDDSYLPDSGSATKYYTITFCK